MDPNQPSQPQNPAPSVPPQAPPEQTTPQEPVSPQQPAKKGPGMPIIIAAVALVVVLIGGLLYISFAGNSPDYQSTVETAPLPTATPTLTPTPSSVLENTDTGDSQLERDLESVDQSMDAATEELNNVDEGLSDQQTNLTE